MALSGLLQRRSSLCIPRKAFQRPVRCFSSLSSDAENEKPSKLKKTGMAKHQRAEVVESFVKKYMERNPGVFPKATHIQNEVGGSWYTVKEILQRVKEKMLTQPDNVHSLIDSVPALASAASNSNLSDQPDSGAHIDLAVIPRSTDENITHTPIHAPAGSSSDLVVDATASDVTNLHDSAGSYELHATSLSAKSERKGSGIERDASANAVSDNLQLQLENGNMLYNEVHSNMSESSGRDPVLNSTKLSDLEHNKVNYCGHRDQQENKEFTCSPFLNLCSDMIDKSALQRSSGKVRLLAELFRNKMDDEAITELKNGHLKLEGLHSGTFSLERERNSPVNSSNDPFSSSDSASNMQLTGLNNSVSTEYENHPTEEEMTISSETQSLRSKWMEPFTTAKKTGSLKDMITINNQASKVMNNRKSDVFMERYMGHLEDHKEKDESKTFEIKHLIDCIKKLPQTSTTKSQENTPTCEKDGISNRSRQGSAEVLAVLRGLGKEGRKVSEGNSVCRKLEDDRSISILPANMNIDNDTTSRPELAIPDSTKSPLTDKKESNEIKDKFFLSEESDQNKVVVKFLRTVTERDVYNAFRDCGDISKVEMSIVEGAFYQVAYVYFRTRKGLRKAVEKTDLYIRNAHLTVEAADLIEDISDKIPIPNLIGDPNVPAALVKNPTRTVMIRKLTQDISSHHIEAALTLCSSNVTGFFLGSSTSVAYVEFETEEGKETALAKRSIDVLGRQLLISRIDVPRTTVVRISHPPSTKMADVIKACNSAGKVRATRIRCEGLLDVYYRVTEWPNMLNILNRLNEIQVDGWPLVAQPATVIPPEILCVLWQQPEERKYVKAMVKRLLYRVGENVPITGDFLDRVENFYRDEL